MRSSAHIKGHPIHPMLIPFPFAYLFGSAVLDIWASATGRRKWFRTAGHMNKLGLGSAVVAAVPGLVDYVFAVPPKSSAQERATKHMLANLSSVALFAAARIGRRDADARPAIWSIAVEVLGAGLLAAGGWMGGTLVSRNQISVDHRYANAGKWKVDAIPAGALAESGETDVGSSDELKVDQMKLLRVGDHRIVLARTEAGYVAFDDRCTHKGGPLSDGVLACGTVQCPWHGSQFDVKTGAVRQGPASRGIETYEVSERDGRVWLRMPVMAGSRGLPQPH
jgi:nitrite reductase/ring-hydroxylating ferredoxin subunit/uncharacterized membrane protein